jgi:hypothetical protein
MYALAQLEMTEAHARVRHGRMVAARRPARLWRGVRARLRFPAARRRVVAPGAPA